MTVIKYVLMLIAYVLLAITGASCLSWIVGCAVHLHLHYTPSGVTIKEGGTVSTNGLTVTTDDILEDNIQDLLQ